MFNIFRKKEAFNLEKFGHGLVESPLDIRDFLLSNVTTLPKRIPPEFLPPFDLTILDQNGYPHCVGYACATIKEGKELREKIHQKFNGDWIYNECKKIDGIPEIKGTFFRVGLKVLKNLGAMPVGGGDPGVYKIGSYALVDDTSFDGLKKAFVMSGDLLAGYRGSNQGWSNKIVRPPKEGESAWGHAVTIVGYTQDYIIGQNSWGSQWGDKGLFFIPKDYKPIEAWAILTDLPTEKQTGRIGWVAEKFISLNKVVPSIGLNMRQGAGIRYKTIETLPHGKQVELLGERVWADNYWWIKIKVV